MQLSHSPARITREVLINLELATADGAWPAYAGNEPDSPDNCITTYTTQGKTDSRAMVDGSTHYHYGIQVRVRSSDPAAGFARAEAIREALCKQVSNRQVNVETSTYLVPCYANVGQVLEAGKDNPASKRPIFTVNALMTVRVL